MVYSSGQELYFEPEGDFPESPIVLSTSGSSYEEEEETGRSCKPDMALLFQPLKHKQQPADLLVRWGGY